MTYLIGYIIRQECLDQTFGMYNKWLLPFDCSKFPTVNFEPRMGRCVSYTKCDSFLLPFYTSKQNI